MSPIVVNGAPGLLLDTGEYPSVITFIIDRRRISEIDVVRNPEKLGTLLGSGR
jgi:hypothetical protein